METLIVYATKYGFTRKCALNLSKDLIGEVDLFNLKDKKSFDLEQYDKVIIGGSIYIGQIRKEVSAFCNENLSLLKGKKIGLFICGMRDGDMAKEEIESSFPKDLLDVAVTKEHFGGEFIFSKMKFFERLIVKKVSNIYKDTSNVLVDNINKFTKMMNNA